MEPIYLHTCTLWKERFCTCVSLPFVPWKVVPFLSVSSARHFPNFLPPCRPAVLSLLKNKHTLERERERDGLRKWWKQGDVVDFLPFKINLKNLKKKGDVKADGFYLLFWRQHAPATQQGIRLVSYCRVRLLVCISAHYGTAAHMQKVHSVPYWRAKHGAVWVDAAPPITSHQIGAYCCCCCCSEKCFANDEATSCVSFGV